MAKPKKHQVCATDSALPLGVGCWVEIDGLSGLGQVLELDEVRKRARVQMNGMAVTVALGKINPSAPPPAPTASNLVKVLGRSAMQYEIDLHGMRVEEALATADRALDQAVTNHLQTFRIIHGHGTGALRKAIREMLKSHPHVSDFRFGEPHEGGLACTVANLKSIQK